MTDCVHLTRAVSEMKGVDGVMLSPPLCAPYGDTVGLKHFLLTAGKRGDQNSVNRITDRLINFSLSIYLV